MSKKAPYFGVELDAKKKMPPCARAAGVDVGVIAWGLLELWEHVWLTKTATVPPIVVEGCFGAAPKLIDALVAYGFLEAMVTGYRVKGAAEKLLGVRQAQSDAGKANAGNLKQNQKPVGNPDREPEGSRSAQPVGSAGETRSSEPAGSRPALSPTTHHPPPTTQKEEAASSPKQLPAPPLPAQPTDKFADGHAFWAFFQNKRHEVGLVPEKLPRASLSHWWSEVGMELSGEFERLEAAVYRFAEHKHWQQATPPVPFTAFMSEWRSFVPQARR